MPANSPGPVQPPSSPLVGRVRELRLLREHLTTALDGRGSLVLVGGEAGVGKTTLVEAIVNGAVEAGALVLRGHCYDLTTTPPYGPWIELFERYRMSGEAPLLSAGDADQSSQSAWFETVRADLARLAASRQLVVVLEDLHWADEASLELLRYLARGLDARPLLVIATYREDEITRRHALFQLLPLLVREAGAERLHVSRFDHDDLEALVAGRFVLSESDRARLVAYLERLSDGNALFATELLRALIDEQRLVPVDGGWRLSEIERTQVPRLVQQMIEVRLARLDDGTQRLLEIAALIGQDVPLDLWSTVSVATDTDLTDAIERATAAGLLLPDGGGASLQFAHALVRETLIDRQILLRRRPWHLHIAETLAVLPRPDPDAVAYHLEQAHDPRQIDWLIRAGERAQQRFAWLMAVERFERAQSLLHGDPTRASEQAWLLFRIGLLVRNNDHERSLAFLDEAERLATALDEPLLAALARAHTGLVRCYGRDVRQGLRDLEAGLQALERLDAAGQAQLAHITTTWDDILGVQGRGTLALKLAEVGRFRDGQAAIDGWDAEGLEWPPDAYRAAGVICAYLGQPERARQAFRRSQAANLERNDQDAAGSDGFHILFQILIPYAADQPHERRELVRAVQEFVTDQTDPELSEGYAQAFDGIEHAISGDWPLAVEYLNRFHEESPYWLTPFDIWRLLLARHRGEPQAVWEAIYQALPDGPVTEPGERHFVVFNELQRLAAELTMDAGDLSQTRRWLEAHDRLLDWSGAVLGRAENRALWARFQRLAGDLPASRQHALEALTAASGPRQPLALIACHRTLGALDTADGRYADAEANLQQSLALAEACAAPFERALTLLELAELRAAAGKSTEAAAIVDEVRAICEPLGAVPALARAAELEARIAATLVTDVPGSVLSRRERDVLRLLVEGKSNQEIAAELFISYHTATSHVANILGKLGVESRTAAATYAVRHGLV